LVAAAIKFCAAFRDDNIVAGLEHNTSTTSQTEMPESQSKISDYKVSDGERRDYTPPIYKNIYLQLIWGPDEMWHESSTKFSSATLTLASVARLLFLPIRLPQ
jgi:hypothetical protein